MKYLKNDRPFSMKQAYLVTKQCSFLSPVHMCRGYSSDKIFDLIK